MQLLKTIIRIFGIKKRPDNYVEFPPGNPNIPNPPKEPSESTDVHEKEEQDFNSQHNDLLLDQFKQDTKNQNRLFNFIICICIASLAFVALIIFLNAFNVCRFDISDDLLKIIIISVASKIVGLLYIITWYLFPKKRRTRNFQ